MKKFAIALAFVLVLSTAAFAADSWTGYVTDSKCAAGGKGGADHAACAKKCLGGGDSAVLVVDGKVVKIANQDKVKGHEGHHVTVTGKLDGDSLTIASLKMVDEKKADAPK
jgi:uncharacterized protein YdeI (BOF family)